MGVVSAKRVMSEFFRGQAPGAAGIESVDDVSLAAVSGTVVSSMIVPGASTAHTLNVYETGRGCGGEL